ncbi:hypothetical protein HNY73_006689 [Argiope bruennichi]|uniref:Uncharacterized protein n=2 Tax=Argiope bruennichi TaxID=94029 RepID=A0A8T0FIM7_ARGBR|nr:hypothetical protein HNY73_006689 [Argiope bruennichi]
MTAVAIPFLLSMLLGRTIDLTTYHIGGEIYDHNEYDETPRHYLNSTYTVLQENVFPYSHIGLPADIVLRIKSDDLHSASGALGLDGLLKETSWKSNSVVIAVTSAVQTVLREIKKDAPLLDNWTTRTDSSQTHYVHAQAFGGWSSILYRFKCKHSGLEEKVRKLLTSALGVSGPMDEKAVGLWQSALAALRQDEELKDNVNVEVHVYSSVPHSEDITSPDSILKAIKKFPEDVGKLGKPLYVELKPLHDLNHKFPIVRPDNNLEEYFLKLDEMYDDVRSTKLAIRKWIFTSYTEFTEEEEEKISHLFDHVSGCTNLFHSIAREASIYKSIDKVVYHSAQYLYRKGLEKGIANYRQQYLRLREDTDPDCKKDFNDKITGILVVAENERIEAGEMKEGLEGCKALCLKEPKCRSIRYVEKLPVIVGDSEADKDVQNSKARLIMKWKQ